MISKEFKCRFAPSPTGFLHVGNIRTAIINFLYAKKVGGQFVLRLDDTDIKRTKDEYRDGILKDLEWLGLDYCGDLFKQSDRLDLYEKAKDSLIKSGKLYPCYESGEDLAMQRKMQIASGQRPIYDRVALNLTDEQRENYEKQGVKPHYRFLLKDDQVSWNDKVKGEIKFNDRAFSDPVLVRDNGVPTYTFCSVVDDIDMNITDIIRGEDHITNTAVQIQIFEALGGKVPGFSHLALVKASEGKISKRIGGFDIKSLRKEGFEPLSILNLLSQIGTSNSLMINSDIKELVDSFDINDFSKSSTKYSIDELSIINHKLLQEMSFDQVITRLSDIGFDDDFE